MNQFGKEGKKEQKLSLRPEFKSQLPTSTTKSSASLTGLLVYKMHVKVFISQDSQ